MTNDQDLGESLPFSTFKAKPPFRRAEASSAGSWTCLHFHTQIQDPGERYLQDCSMVRSTRNEECVGNACSWGLPTGYEPDTLEMDPEICALPASLGHAQNMSTWETQVPNGLQITLMLSQSYLNTFIGHTFQFYSSRQNFKSVVFCLDGQLLFLCPLGCVLHDVGIHMAWAMVGTHDAEKNSCIGNAEVDSRTNVS